MTEPARSGPWLGGAWAVLRVRQWAVFLPLPTAGVQRLDDLRGPRAPEIATAIVATGLALAYAYGINAIFDRRADLDERKNVLAGQERVPLPVVASVACAGLGAVVLGAALGGGAFRAMAASVAAGTLYSAGPRLKRFPVAGLAGNALIFLPLMFVAVRPGAAPAGLGVLVTQFALLLTQNQLLHEEGDADEDAASGAWTTGRWLGPTGVRAAVVALSGAMALCGVIGTTRLAAATCLVGAVLTASVGWSREGASRRRSTHRYVAAAVGLALFLALLDRP